MHKSRLLVFLAAALLTAADAATAQVLFRFEPGTLPDSVEARVWWSESMGTTGLGVVPEARFLPMGTEILEPDMEARVYVWVETRDGSPVGPVFQNRAVPGTLVWHEGRRGLVRLRSPAPASIPGLKTLPARMRRTPALQNPNRIARAVHAAVQPEAVWTPAKQALMDSIDVERLSLKDRQLSGELPVSVGGGTVTLKTRFSYSPEVTLAGQWLEQQLTGLGYAVKTQSFSMREYQDMLFAPGDSTAGWLVSDYSVFGTRNGTDWDLQVPPGDHGALWSLFALNRDTAWAAGDRGTLLATANGIDWTRLPVPTEAMLFGVFFIDAHTGWVCGDDGLILKTTDSGRTWTLQAPPVDVRLYDVEFISPLKGWIVGRNGVILRTEDGGASWTVRNSGTTARLFDIEFLDSQTAMAAGWYGTLLRSVDAGESWSFITQGISGDFREITFCNSDQGLLTGYGGAIFVSDNGGASWERLNPPRYRDVNSGARLDSQRLWICGDGLFMESPDRGRTWINRAGAVESSGLNNIIAEKPGTRFPEQAVVLCAHYDSISEDPYDSAPGADDNASGTAAVLEAARVLAPMEFDHTLRFILFAGEEQGLVGSDVYAVRLSEASENLAGVINLDMIAYDGNKDGSFEIHSGFGSPSQAIGFLIADNAALAGLPVWPQIKSEYSSSWASDHASFWRAGYPAVMVIEDFEDFTPFYHTASDRFQTLNTGYFHALARASILSIYDLAQPVDTSGADPAVMVPEGFVLESPWPNPFNSGLHIRFGLDEALPVQVTIHNMLGREIRSFKMAPGTPGWRTIVWNGNAENGSPAPSGIYIIRAAAGSFSAHTKAVLVR